MESRAKLLGHPIHQMLIVFPLGLLATSVIFDIIYLITDNRRWTEIAFWMIAAGIIGGLLGGILGLISLLGVPRNTRAKTRGLMHGGANVLAVLLFIGSWLLRRNAPDNPDITALAPSFCPF